VFVVGINCYLEYIMNQIHIAARLAQGLLAVTIVFAIGLVFQLTTIVN
jgi:hypothetical protein